MFKVLIIDDEAVVRRGLRTIIDWEKYDFYVCGDAIDGKDGLNKILELKPDIAFVDIKMPYMDGLEMLKELNKLRIKCKIVLLTGYAEFEYAKQAITFGAKAYLLKPFDEEEINSILSNVSQEIKKEQNNQLLAQTHKNLMIEEIIHDVLFGDNLTDNMKSQKIINLFSGWKKYGVIMIIFEDEATFLKNRIEFKERLSKYIIENGYGYSFELSGKYGLLLNWEVVNQSCESDDFIEKLRKVISSLFNNEVRLAIGRIVDTIGDVKLSYEDVCEVENKKFIYNKQRLIYRTKLVENCESANTINNIDIAKDYDAVVEKLYFAVVVNNDEDIKNILKEISCQVIEKTYSEEKIKHTYVELYKDVIKLTEEKDSNCNFSKFYNDQIVNDIFLQKYIEDLNYKIFYQLKEISNCLFEAEPKYKIKKLVEYVKNNFHKDLRLEDFCESFYYSKSYIGKLFKSYTGQKFDVYVDLLRIEKAKELLLEGLKVYEVAKKVGFNNIDYFYSKFKKYTGVSPREYKVNKFENFDN